MRVNVSALRIPQDILDGMVAQAREVAPFEACGIVAGQDETVVSHYRITNTIAHDHRAVQVFHEAHVKQLEGLTAATRAEVAYFMDPKEMLAAFKDMRQRGLDLTVIYHSHPHSPAYPSRTDIGLAYYSEAAYLIISLQHDATPDLRVYWIRDGQVLPAEVSPV